MRLARLMPHPLLSTMLLVLWLWLQETIALGHLLLGAALALGLPYYTAAFVPRVESLPDARRLLAFIALVLGDIVIANIVVAVRILGPTGTLRPVFIEVPLDTDHPGAMTVLASTISLTPGTVSAELSEDRSHLLVHALDVAPDDDPVRTIKERYERPIMELFR